MNDIFNVSNFLFTILYADDTCVALDGKSLENLITLMNQELHKNCTTRQTSEEHCGPSLPVWIQQQSRWWRLFEWRSLRGQPGCQVDATEQLQVTHWRIQGGQGPN